MKTRHLTATLTLIAIAGLLAGCVPNTAAGDDGTIVAVDSSAEACELDTTTVESGPVTFRVTNSGDSITEFYLLGEDGRSIISEVEDIAPGSTRDLTVVAQPGNYVTECKPGMTGTGVGRAEFTVTAGSTQGSFIREELFA